MGTKEVTTKEVVSKKMMNESHLCCRIYLCVVELICVVEFIYVLWNFIYALCCFNQVIQVQHGKT